MKEEGNGELPEGWHTSRLDELFEIRTGGTPDRKNVGYYQDGTIPWVKTSEVQNCDIHTTDELITEEAFANSNAKIFPPTTILIALYGEGRTRGQIATLQISASTNQACAALVNLSLLDATRRYVYFRLRYDYHALRGESAGGNQPNLNLGLIRDWEIPIPPLAEQHRIVANVEAALSKVNAARERLNRVPAILKRFRQAVLSAACSGRLTADWREKNPIIESNNSLSEDSSPDADLILLEIPVEWEWSQLCRVASVERGKFSIRPRNDPRYYGGNYPFVQIGNLPPEGGMIREFQQTLNDSGLSVSRLFPKGTALIAIVGATIGNTGVLEFDSCCPDSLVAIQGITSETQFLEFYLRMQKDSIRNESYSSGGQPNINLQTLRPLLVPNPPLAEQQEIVCRVNDLFALVDRIEARLTDARQMADQLTQAVLAKAFRGELVPTEAELARREKRTYESGAELLARIKVEREKSEPPAKRMGKGSTGTADSRNPLHADLTCHPPRYDAPRRNESSDAPRPWGRSISVAYPVLNTLAFI